MILTYKNLEMYPVQNYILTELYLEYRSENNAKHVACRSIQFNVFTCIHVLLR